MASESRRVDRLWPDPAFGLEMDDAFADLDLPRPPLDRPWVSINMVTSVDGRAQLQGSADGLGSRADRRLMRLLRAGHDAVASGVGTLRATGVWLRVPDDIALRRTMRGRTPQPVGIVIAGTGEVPLDAKWFGGDEPRILIVGRDSPHADRPEVIPTGTDLLVAPSPEPDPDWIVDELHERGIRSMLLEGGPHINAAFLSRGLIDEVFWTIGPKLVANDGLPMISRRPRGSSEEDDQPVEGELVSIHRHGYELFLRYRFG